MSFFAAVVDKISETSRIMIGRVSLSISSTSNILLWLKFLLSTYLKIEFAFHELFAVSMSHTFNLLKLFSLLLFLICSKLFRLWTSKSSVLLIIYDWSVVKMTWKQIVWNKLVVWPWRNGFFPEDLEPCASGSWSRLWALFNITMPPSFDPNWLLFS